MKKKMFSLLLAAFLSVSMVLPVQAASFRDVSRNHWAYSSIESMAKRGIVTGTGKGSFAPEGYVTTAEFISMLMRLFYGQELAMDTAEYSIWYGKVLQQAAEKGLLYKLDIASVNHKAAGAEKWNRAIANGPIQRQDAAIILYHFLKQKVALPAEGTLRAVTAEKIPDLERNTSIFEQFAIASVYELGCLSGIDQKGNFGAEEYMTRAQACVALARTEKLVQAHKGSNVGADWTKKAEIGLIKEKLALPRLANGEKITEENVSARLYELQRIYPHGMSCTNENFFYKDPRTGEVTGNSGCYAFAMTVYDFVFGYNSFYRAKGTVLHEGTFANIKPGDHIRIHDLPHSVVVLDVSEKGITVFEGNFNGKVHWGNCYSKAELLGYEKVTIYSVY